MIRLPRGGVATAGYWNGLHQEELLCELQHLYVSQIKREARVRATAAPGALADVEKRRRPGPDFWACYIEALFGVKEI